MSDTVSCAEFGEHEVELLPARTVLSLFHADLLGGGDAGAHGNNGESQRGASLFGMIGWGGSNTTPTDVNTQT